MQPVLEFRLVIAVFAMATTATGLLFFNTTQRDCKKTRVGWCAEAGHADIGTCTEALNGYGFITALRCHPAWWNKIKSNIPLPVVWLILDTQQQPNKEEETCDICWQSSICNIHVGRDRGNGICQHCRRTTRIQSCTYTLCTLGELLGR